MSLLFFRVLGIVVWICHRRRRARQRQESMPLSVFSSQLGGSEEQLFPPLQDSAPRAGASAPNIPLPTMHSVEVRRRSPRLHALLAPKED